jgi:uncharacterized protein (DUF1330 family)
MPAAYVIVEMKIADPERYRAYMVAAPATIAAAGGEYVVRGGPLEVLEGDWQPSRVAVLRVPSLEQARAWYDGEGYRTARTHRAGATDYFNAIVVEGYLPPPA